MIYPKVVKIWRVGVKIEKTKNAGALENKVLPHVFLVPFLGSVKQLSILGIYEFYVSV